MQRRDFIKKFALLGAVAAPVAISTITNRAKEQELNPFIRCTTEEALKITGSFAFIHTKTENLYWKGRDGTLTIIAFS